MENSDHAVISVLISEVNTPFYCRAYDYSCTDWHGICDHQIDVPWVDIFKLSAFAATAEFCE